MAPGLAAQAQNLPAAAPSQAAKLRPGYVVFFEQNSIELSQTATQTIRLAADASRADKAHIIRIVGRADHAEAVKSALMLQGVLPTSIVVVGRDDTGPIVRASTGAVEPINRRVLIHFEAIETRFLSAGPGVCREVGASPRLIKCRPMQTQST